MNPHREGTPMIDFQLKRPLESAPPSASPALRTGGSPPPRKPVDDDPEDVPAPSPDTPYPPQREGPFMPDNQPVTDPTQRSATE